jgi:aminomethyltransferase
VHNIAPGLDDLDLNSGILKRTPLYATHVKLGGKLIEFGGWEMPVQYTSIVDEHMAVRTAAGIFDISHMGEVLVRGPSAGAFLNQTLTNDIRNLSPGAGQYTLMCNPQGGVIDDLYVYRLGPEGYLLIINASRIEADTAWLDERLNASSAREGVTLRNISDEAGAVAVQGPRVVEFIDRCFPGPSSAGTLVKNPSDLKKNQVAEFAFEDQRISVARTGYTGEDGFEVVAPAMLIQLIFNRILDLGKEHGLKPAGLGARDTLRTEVCYPLYGHELDSETTPIEAGLGFFVSLDKGDFVGRPRLAEQKLAGTQKKLVAVRMSGKSAPPRPGYPVLNTTGQAIGKVVSGTQSPSLGVGIGLAYVPPAYARPETSLQIEIRGKPAGAVVVPKPIYRKLV